MEVILLQKVANLGNIGDRVKVSSGYGRNFLLPQGKATLATSDNVARFEARRAELEKLAREQLSSARRARRGDEGIQAHHPRPRPAPRASCSVPSAPATSPRPPRARASRWSAAKCACRRARCAWWASTSSPCTCTPTSTCRSTSRSSRKSNRLRAGTTRVAGTAKTRGDSGSVALVDAPVPPHSVEAEQAVLGGLMLDTQAWDNVADAVVADDFYRPDHRADLRPPSPRLPARRSPATS